jgi:glycosyltransferase involved in cell wall biosynthesis
MNVSVIITTHNRPTSLKDAVDSVLEQSLLPFEILIINDGKGNEVIDYFIREGKVQVHTNSFSSGANYSRNKGASLAKGDLLMFLDDDDTWEINKIHDQIQALTMHPEAGLVYSGKIMVYDTDRTAELYRTPANTSGYMYPEILKKNLIGTTSGVAIKKEVFFRAGGFDERLPAMQDYLPVGTRGRGWYL